MANIQFIDGAGSTKYIKTASGSGAVGDPFISTVELSASTTTVVGKVIISSISGRATIANGVLLLTSASTVYQFTNNSVVTHNIMLTRPYGGSGNVYIGGSGLTLANGFPIHYGTPTILKVLSSESIYAISDAASQEIRFLVQ